MLARINSMKTRRTDEPGAVLYWDGAPEDKPQWEDVPEIPQSLFRVIDTVMQIMRLIASDDQSEAQADLTNVAAKTLQQVIEESLNRWDDFRQEMAEWDAAIMRHSLLLCARHYSEPRLMKIKGRDGWERVPDFQGAELMGEVDVRVFPDSLIPQTRQGVQDQLTWINANFPGWLQPQDALAAIQEGSVDRLWSPTGSTWRAPTTSSSACVTAPTWRCRALQRRPDHQAADHSTRRRASRWPVPGYMPDQQDNLAVWKKVFADWMKTDDYSRQDPPVQDAARQVWQAIQALEQAKAVRTPRPADAARRRSGDGERRGPADEGDAVAARLRAAARPPIELRR
jgi:hypothetical protein